MSKDLILGTAGHIDHGKTSLVRALTGIDTDRLPEEKRRGITIELGYAHLEIGPYRLGIVDVPGHEKFIRQMLSGATGMDLAMLVVAADDSIKQQTREHLDILRMLDLAAGIIVITKVDLVDPQWLELVREEIRELVQGTVFENSEIVATSTKTQQGILELKEAILRAAQEAESREDERRKYAPFRLPIDRAFAVEGFGTVVTGSVVSGRASIGDSVIIHPLKIEARIRGLQNHDQPADEIHQGQRAAVNLAGVHHDVLSRGLELAAPGFLEPANVMTIELFILPDATREFESRTRVRFHLGTQENLGVIRLLEGSSIQPGGRALGQVYLDDDSVAAWGQPFVIRQESPMVTLGGGRILDPHAQLLKRPTSSDLDFVRRLCSPDLSDRVEAAAFLDNTSNWSPTELPGSCGVYDPVTTVNKLLTEKRLIEVVISAQRRVLIHHLRFEQLADQIKSTLHKLHDSAPLKLHHALGDLMSRLAYLNQPEVVLAAVHHLARNGQVTLQNQQIALEGHGPKLNKAERQLLPQLVESIRAAGINVPTLKELQQTYVRQKDSVPQLLRLAEGSGDLVAISDDLFLHKAAMEQIQSALRKEFAGRAALTVSDIREVLQTSRKYAVPLCEYFDRIGFTVRNGDVRQLKAQQQKVPS